ncbi:hypothetical protein [Microbacterium sp. UBA3394]|uniref:hypothetical protein n=1 Tax=Microbacterium sp. UBA3394 TaxID=1946945 RepID=UPI00257FC0D6|nr:hypothetical protein [Microbacterium sp. UBA3394]|tara:strand:+ start:17781 stop:18659 length:879 start_codon:yes stop_codon:yes gene_type:complete
MSTTTIAGAVAPRYGLSFGGIIRSEVLKLLSIPSTVWAYVVMAAITIGIAAQVSASTDFSWAEVEVSQAGMQATGAYALSISRNINVLVVSALGVLVIAGEYSTGMIRSTFTAVPRRVPAVIAKFLVFAAVTSLAGMLATVIALPITLPLLAENDVHVQAGDPHLWRVMIGTVGYLTAVGLISMGIGAVVRNVAGGLTAAFGLVVILPAALGLVGGLEQPIWLQNAAVVLPLNLGAALTMHPGYPDFAAPGVEVVRPEGLWVLEPWHGAIGLAIWVVVALAAALVAVKRRDV